MKKRLGLALLTTVSLLLAGGASLLSSSYLASSINAFLPEGWQVALPDKLDAGLHNAKLPALTLTYQNCPLLSVRNLELSWQNNPQLNLDQATLDYQCLTQLPSSESESEFSPADLISLSLINELNIQALNWVNLPSDLPASVQTLLTTPSHLHAKNSGHSVVAELEQKQLAVQLKLTASQFSGQINYKPAENNQHQMQLSGQFSQSFAKLPQTLNLNYQWQLPTDVISEPRLQQGDAFLTYQEQANGEIKGLVKASSSALPHNQIRLPFQFDGKTLAIEQGQFFWDFLPNLPLQGFITSQLTPTDWLNGNFFPMQSYLRLSLQSNSPQAGKGNIVLESKQGVWQNDSLNLPLRMTGEVKHQDLVLYSAVPAELKGNYQDLTLKFLPTALLRLVGKAHFLKVQDLRFPLAGISLDKFGLNGRLQALFKGSSPDFDHIDFHLDGYAHHFKMGQASLFDSLPQKELEQDRWQWKFWGGSKIEALGVPIKLQGRGDWHQNQVQLNEFSGVIDKIKRPAFVLQPTQLKLLKPIQFAYEKLDLSGDIELSSPELRFNYGGIFNKPTATLAMNGNIENLNLKATLQAGKIGPLRLFARRSLNNEQASEIVGRLYWNEQPASVFQSLLPLRQNWVITQGTIRGETAFSLNEKQGLIAGGHFAIQQGGISTPDGKIKGVHFSLPYRLEHQLVNLGHQQPLAVNIDEINLGFPIRNIKMKVQGHYPYSAQKPLHLSELSMQLLGGLLAIEHFTLPQTELAYLKLNQIQFEQLFAVLQYPQIKLQGKADATLPFWLKGKPCYICDGLMTQAGNSHLSFSEEFIKGIEQGGYTEKMLLSLINNTDITKMNSLINLGSNGDMVLDAKLQMELPEQEKGKVNFNYHHQENLFELWQLVSQGSNVEQNIENQLYQKLEKQE